MDGSNPGGRGLELRHGQGREVDDEELFGHLTLLPHPRPRQRPPGTLRKCSSASTPRRPRSSSTDLDEISLSNSHRKKDSLARHYRAREEDTKKDEPQHSLNDARRGVPHSPRTYEDITALFATTREVSMLRGAPRLSVISINAARLYAAAGNIKDLSMLPDEFVYDILCHSAINPELLHRLEELNPSRVNVLEAVWARLCGAKFEERELPNGVYWWRTLYELHVEREHQHVERVTKRLRLGCKKPVEERELRHMGTSKTIQMEKRRRRASSGSASNSGSIGLLARMRLDFRKERRRR